MGPTAPLLVQASERGVPVWGEVELAWRMMQPDRGALAGDHNKRQGDRDQHARVDPAGGGSADVPQIGRPIVEALLDEEPYDVLAVELSSFQLHWCHTVRLHSAAVLNFEADHLEWYAHEADPMAAYMADKARIYEGVTHSCVYNVADPITEQMVMDADVTEGARAIGFTLGIPSVSMLGVVDDMLVDRAFVAQRRDSAMPLAALSDVQPYAPHNVENALAAAAPPGAFGVPAGCR